LEIESCLRICETSVCISEFTKERGIKRR